METKDIPTMRLEDCIIILKNLSARYGDTIPESAITPEIRRNLELYGLIKPKRNNAAFLEKF